MKSIPAYLPEELYEELRKLAYDKKTSMAEEIRKAVEKHVKESEPNE